MIENKDPPRENPMRYFFQKKILGFFFEKKIFEEFFQKKYF